MASFLAVISPRKCDSGILVVPNNPKYRDIPELPSGVTKIEHSLRTSDLFYHILHDRSSNFSLHLVVDTMIDFRNAAMPAFWGFTL